MVGSTEAFPEGWGPVINRGVTVYIASVLMILSGFYWVIKLWSFSTVNLLVALFGGVLLLWAVRFAVIDAGKNPGDSVKLFPDVEMPDSDRRTLDSFISLFESNFKDFQRVADPTGGPLRANSSRYVYINPEKSERVITIGRTDEELLEVGVNAKAFDTIPRIEAFFKTEGRRGSKWIVPEMSYEFRFYPFILLMIVGGLIPFLLFYPHGEIAWIFMLVIVAIAIPLLISLRNHKTDRLLQGAIFKHLVIDKNDCKIAIEMAAEKLGVKMILVDDEIPPNRNDSKSDFECIDHMYRIEGIDVQILITSRLRSGARQGYYSICIPRYYRIDEGLAKRFMRTIDEVLSVS